MQSKTMTTTHIDINGIRIGPGEPPYFVAELGICHGGDLEVALQLARQAAAAGAPCVKTETFQADRLVGDPALTTSYVINGETRTELLAEHMSRFQLSFNQHHAIKKECDRLGVSFMATAHDAESVEFLKDIGAAAVKAASPDLIHIPLLRCMAASGLAVFLDTGSAHLHEIVQAVSTLRGAGAQRIVVNHNPAGHPAAAHRHDLRQIPRLMQILGVPVGISDHYEGYDMLPAATALGACALEKPISEDRFVQEPERNWSISIADLPEQLQRIREVYLALQPMDTLHLTPEQEQYRLRNRMSLVAAKDLAPGDPIDLQHVDFARPRQGIGVEHWDAVHGRLLRRAKPARSFIDWSDLE
ncbi:MAG: hypothetical protein BM485_03120 [Desulfobulbaceae bacterium DB1]|nr:MAG: hypothetical protein BM485_03120 [Desulfobulbaceae bacterium DB1]